MDNVSFLDSKEDIASESHNGKWVKFLKELPPKIILSARF